MQDAEVVAAIVAGDPDGFAEAYDRYAAALYAYCHFMLPSPDDAADAVRDTFLIASSQLSRLRDPAKLRLWLHAVARNECLRRLSAAGTTARPPKPPGDGALPAIELPATLRRQVLGACADNTPAGRADRATAAHQAGTFGPSGFPKAIGAPAPLWWQWLRRRPRIAAAMATVAVAMVAGVLIALATVGGSHTDRAATTAHGSSVFGGSPGTSGTPGSPGSSVSPGPGASSSPGRPQASPRPGQPTPAVTALGGITSPASPTRGGTAPKPSASSVTSASPSPSPSPSSSSASPPPVQGVLAATPDRLVLASTSGKAVSGTFLLSAQYGPVSSFVIKVPAAMAGKVKVSPVKGSLGEGGWITVTVTVTSKVAISTDLAITPGNLNVAILLSIKR